MTGQGHLLIADFRTSASASDVQGLVAKLQRRGFWTTLLDPGAPLPGGAAGVAVFLDAVASGSQALRTISGQAHSAGIPVVAWLDGVEPSPASGNVPSSVILVHGRDASRDRALSRFANTIAAAGVGSTPIEPPAGADRPSPETGPAVHHEAVWSWPGALLGPLWPVASGRPLAGFLGLALLMAGTMVAASLARSPLAPWIGFAAAWLAFAVLMGLFGGERDRATQERWFRPVGVLALAVVVGFVALVGWSKAQTERGALQSQTARTTGNTVLVGRQPSTWSWDVSWMEGIRELPYVVGGSALPGVGEDFTPIDTQPAVPIIVPSPPLPSDDRETCARLAEQNGGKQSKDIETIIFCGDQVGTPPA